MPSTVAPTSRASSTAFTMLTETPCSREPPPTENTRTASSARSREPRSQAAYAPSQPSSLTRAVSSETLSLGA